MAAVDKADADRAAFAFAYRMQAPVWVFDVDASRVLFANQAACGVWQAQSETELQRREFGSTMSSTVQKRLKQYQADFAHGRRFNEVWTIYPNGEPTSLDVNYSGFPLQSGRYAMLCEANVSQNSTPDNIRSTEALLHTDVMISLFRREGPPLYMNPAARNAAINADQTFSELFVDTRDYDLLMFELDRKGEHSLVAKIYTEQGLRWHNLSVKLCADAATGEPAILLTANDVSELKTARDKARYLAHRDQLTGCYNRSYLQQTVRQLARFHRQKCGLLFFDVDRFKQINDRFGHEIGDCVLKSLASRAEAALTPSETLVRLGGDEFVILYRNVTDETALSARVEAMLDKMREPIRQNTIQLSPTVSMGLTFFLPGHSSLTTVMREADIALYASKLAGRDQLTVFDEELGSKAQARDQLEIDLKHAIEQDEFVLYYQPRVDIATNRILAAEALVRWQHPTRGMVPPNEFIPVCEETGMIVPLGQIVLQRGLSQMEIWAASGIEIGLSINVSPAQFASSELITTLRHYASRANFPTNLIELEITENMLIDDKEALAEQLKDIASLGYRIAIDDFGVGYSNLSHISSFPVNCIKIDRSFISKLPAAGPVVRLIFALAAQMNASTVAEGIETEEQAKWLAERACNQGQGFLFYKPMPLADLMAALKAEPTLTATNQK